ncbi:MAG: ABC transporter ATP-binding protein [Clostridiaceae bacterium]|jgi:iron complex transport system ATP-binding protein|nr:ABC transporter ATP-binding protein [Clostridiaceae bacterium]
MLIVENLQFNYHSGPEILKQISFSLDDGQFMAILGNNGAGKSTMLKCLNRILPAKHGRIYMDEQNLLQMPNREIAKRIAFVAQTVPDMQMTVHDIVMLGRRPYMRWGFTKSDHDIVHESMGRLDLLQLRGRFLNQLSGGERQKVVLARALAQQPKVLLLDEPTSSLDLQNQYQVLEIVRDICHNGGISAIMVIHDLNLALRFCDRFLMLKEGHVYRYGDRAIIDRQSILDIYGVNAEIVAVKGHNTVLVD